MKKTTVSLLIILILVSISLTGCIHRENISSSQKEDILPVLREKIEKTISNSNVENSYEIY